MVANVGSELSRSIYMKEKNIRGVIYKWIQSPREALLEAENQLTLRFPL